MLALISGFHCPHDISLTDLRSYDCPENITDHAKLAANLRICFFVGISSRMIFDTIYILRRRFTLLIDPRRYKHQMIRNHHHSTSIKASRSEVCIVTFRMPGKILDGRRLIDQKEQGSTKALQHSCVTNS